jgi:hypothetical protein
MMEKDKLRRADVFSGSIIFLFGLWVVHQATQMPMKDSWGGVKNVWFVSPALFPLFVGAMIALLGALLVRTALKTVGFNAMWDVLRWMAGPELIRFLKTPALIRFYAMVALFFSFVFVNIARVDFFLGSTLFLAVFITQFYFDDERLLKKLLAFYLAGSLVMAVSLATSMAASMEAVVAHAGDWLTLFFIVAYSIYAWGLIRTDAVLRRRYRIGMILALASPLLIGSAFKYLLLVPMPREGLVVLLLDAIRYWDF